MIEDHKKSIRDYSLFGQVLTYKSSSNNTNNNKEKSSSDLCHWVVWENEQL